MKHLTRMLFFVTATLAVMGAWTATAQEGAPPAAITGTVKIRCTPSDAAISSETLGNTVCPITLPGISPGSHRIVVSATGYEAAEKTFEVKAGETIEVDVVLSPATGLLVLEGLPTGSEIELDGRKVDAPAPDGMSLRPGPFKVVVRSKGCEPWASEGTITRGRVTRLRVGPCAPLQPPVAPVAVAVPPRDTVAETRDEGRHLMISGWSTFAVGVASLAIGAGFGTSALLEKRSLDERCPGGACPADAQGSIDKMNRDALISTVGLSIGAAATATGIVLLIVDATRNKKGADARNTVVPVIASGGAGLAVAF